MVIDSSMLVAFRMAKSFMPNPPIPAWIDDVESCRRAVEGLDQNAMAKKTNADHASELALIDAINRHSSEWAANEQSAPGISPVLARQNVLLRLWAGCTDTAKAIKYRTNSPEPTTPEQRRAWFEETINPNCNDCRIYRAGSLCALAYTAGRNQLNELCLQGVPDNALVLTQLEAIVKTAFAGR